MGFSSGFEQLRHGGTRGSQKRERDAIRSSEPAAGTVMPRQIADLLELVVSHLETVSQKVGR